MAKNLCPSLQTANIIINQSINLFNIYRLRLQHSVECNKVFPLVHSAPCAVHSNKLPPIMDKNVCKLVTCVDCFAFLVRAIMFSIVYGVYLCTGLMLIHYFFVRCIPFVFFVLCCFYCIRHTTRHTQTLGVVAHSNVSNVK